MSSTSKLKLQEGSLPVSSDAVRPAKPRRVPSWVKDEVYIPAYSFGECLKAKRCRQFHVELADGWCVEHWDQGQPWKSKDSST